MCVRACVSDWPGGETKVTAVLLRLPSNFSSKLAKQMENINQTVWFNQWHQQSSTEAVTGC